VTALLLAVTGSAALADGYVITMDTTSSSIMADQKAVIVYREGREDLVISIGLDLQPGQDRQEMAWIIPVPSQPGVQVTGKELFVELDRITAPEIVYKTEHRDGLSWGLSAEAIPQAVEVLERKQVGVYDVAVLAGQEAGALLDWLHAEGFSLPGALKAPLDAYIDEGWTFVAMRIAPDAGQGAVQDAQPVWLSFDADEMVYPMRLTGAQGKPLALRLYILADHRYELDGFTVEFAGWSQVEAHDPLMAPVLDQGFFITKLFNQSVTPADMQVDFYPYQAPVDEPYREQIIETYVSTGMGGMGAGMLELLCPCGLCWLGLAFLLVMIVAAIVLLRRRRQPSPDQIETSEVSSEP
jgi:hypothetical protein